MAAVFRVLMALRSRPRLVLGLREPAWVAAGAAWLVAQGLAA